MYRLKFKLLLIYCFNINKKVLGTTVFKNIPSFFFTFNINPIHKTIKVLKIY